MKWVAYGFLAAWVLLMLAGGKLWLAGDRRWSGPMVVGIAGLGGGALVALAFAVLFYAKDDYDDGLP